MREEMKFDDFIKLVKGMKSVYTKDNFLPDEYSIKMWYKLLQDIPYDVLNVSIQRYMLTNKFSPTIADLREIAANIVQGETLDWGNGWEQVVNGIRKYGFYQESKALETMDDVTRQTVKRLGWAQLCMSENIMTDRANFRMIYEQIAERKKKNDVIPIEVKIKMQKLMGQSDYISDGKLLSE